MQRRKSVNLKAMTDSYERLKILRESYENTNVYNADETIPLFRSLPNKSSCLMSDDSIENKTTKELVTQLIWYNMQGKFETPFMNGKSLKPRCFKNTNPNDLGAD